MKLQHEKLDDFEQIITNLYQITFSTFRISKTLVFSSTNSYIQNCYADFNKGQNAIAKEVIRYAEEKKNLQHQKTELNKEHSENIENINELEEQITILKNRILVLRRLLDSIAMILLDYRVWIAKRFIIQNSIKEVDIPAIKTNLEAANLWNSDHPYDFALVSDLTTYIEVGDLLIRFNTGKKFKLLIVEIKLGDINQSLCNIIDSGKSNDPNVISKFDRTTSKQLGRMIKQKERRDHIVEMVAKDKGTDLITGIPVTLVDRKTEPQYYDDALRHAVTGALKEHVTLCIIEECLTIYASTLNDRDTFHYLFHLIFGTQHCSLDSGSESPFELKVMSKLLKHPYVNDLVVHNMNAKCYTPYFLLPIEKVMFDLLFKRMRVLLYLDIERFLDLFRQKGFIVTLHTKNETRFFQKQYPKTPLFNDRAVKITSPIGKSYTIGSNILNKIFYDIMKPSSVIEEWLD